MMALDQVAAALAAYLSAQGVAAVAGWPAAPRQRVTAPVAAVALRGCDSTAMGFQHYLGERYNAATGRWEERFGRRVKLTFCLDLYAPRTAGEDALGQGFDGAVRALCAGGPEGLSLRAISCGKTEFLREEGLLCRRAEVVYDAGLYAAADESGLFLDFTVRGGFSQ